MRSAACCRQENAIFSPLIHQTWPEPFRGALYKLSGTAEGNCVNANSELMAAAEVGDVAQVEDLLQCPGIDVNVQNQWGQTALYGASKNGHLGVVDKLLAQNGIDVNAGGATPLYIAAEQVYARAGARGQKRPSQVDHHPKNYFLKNVSMTFYR